MTLLFIIFICSYVYSRWKEKRDAIAALGTAQLQVVATSPDFDPPGVLKYSHGEPQVVTIFVNWDSTVYHSERPVQLMLLQDGAVQSSQIWKHDDLHSLYRMAIEFKRAFPIGHYLVRASVEGAPPAQYSFAVQPRPPGMVFVSETIFNGWPQGRLATLQHRSGENQKIYIGVGINGVIPDEGRVVYVALFHEGSALFNYSNTVREQNRNFYLPYEADFSEGAYTARLSADGEPPAEYAFRVQYPVVESDAEKNQRIKQYLDAVLPGSPQSSEAKAPSPTNDSTATDTNGQSASSQDSVPPQNHVRSKFSDCYSGTWNENESNGIIWYFQRRENYLKISRRDGFVGGQFQKSSDGWTGFLNWRNGTRWNGVILHEANEACDEITTNQRWWFKR